MSKPTYKRPQDYPPDPSVAPTTLGKPLLAACMELTRAASVIGRRDLGLWWDGPEAARLVDAVRVAYSMYPYAPPPTPAPDDPVAAALAPPDFEVWRKVSE